MFSKYDDETSKYSGSISASWPEAVDEFEAAAAELDMTDSQRLATLPVRLRGDARRFFATKVRLSEQNFDDAVEQIDAHFNISTNQHGIKNYLLNLKFNQFLEANVNLANALVKLNAEIDRYFPQTPISFKFEDIKISILHSTVVGQQWASSAISELHHPDHTFTLFRSEVATRLQIYQDERAATSNSPSSQ